jgi:hypothetical protein
VNDELPDETRCTLLGERDPKLLNGWEWVTAELWIRHHFGRYVAELPGSTYLTHQLDRLREIWDPIVDRTRKGQGGRPPLSREDAYQYQKNAYMPSDPVLQMALRVLGEDLINPLAPARVRELQRLLDPKSGTPAVRLIEAVRKLAPGGALKPDMLGLQSYAGELTMEALEVGTVTGGLDTYKELRSKVSVLEDPCARRMRLELAAMQRSLQVTPRATTWRLHPALMTVPLPLSLDTTGGKPQVADWLCFWPTNRASFEGYPRDTARPGYDGLVLYHVHRLPFDDKGVPRSVKEKMSAAVREWSNQRRWTPGPTLVPELVTAVQADRRLFTREGEYFLAGLGAAGLLALFCWVAVEAGVITAVSAAGKAGLAALAAAPAQLARAVAGMVEFVKDFIPVVTQMAYAFPARAAAR